MAMRRTSYRTGRYSWPRRSPSRKNTRQWSKDEISFMRKYYRSYETAWIARQLGRTVYSVRYKAVDLNIRKANPSVWKGNTGSSKSFDRTWSKPSHRSSSYRKNRPRRTTQSWKAKSGSWRRNTRGNTYQMY
ncbi:MAG TPA: hypothetical protein VN285_13250 [Candidatus Deferrimicrobium sp.]|nr:hypothetical protein [Candidatus Deferrimicrobium sp.]